MAQSCIPLELEQEIEAAKSRWLKASAEADAQRVMAEEAHLKALSAWADYAELHKQATIKIIKRAIHNKKEDCEESNTSGV
jgi:hypothetical protein